MAFGPEGGPRPKRLHPRTPDFYGGQSRGACLSFRRATYDGAGNSPDGPWPCADLLSGIFRTPSGACLGIRLRT